MQTTKASLIREYTDKGWWGSVRVEHLLDDAVKNFPGRIALVDPLNRADLVGGRPCRWTYSELATRIDSLVLSMHAAGIRAEDIVVVQLPNIVELPLVILALAKLGAIISPVPVQYGVHELSKISEALNASAFLSVRNFKSEDLFLKNRSAFETEIALTIASPDDNQDLSSFCPTSEQRIACQDYLLSLSPNANDLLTICWTSGTTGTPKGVPRSHNHWISIATSVRDLASIRDGDAFLNPFPMVNMGGIGGFLVTWLESAGKLVLHHPIDLNLFLRQISEEEITYTIAPPAILTMLLKDQSLLANKDISALRAIGSGSAPLSSWMIEEWENQHGISILNNFGSNEGMCLAGGPDDVPDARERGELFPRFGVEGFSWSNRISSMVKTKLVDPETGEEIMDCNRPGELLFAGPTIFDGYWDSPHLNGEIFSGEYFHTGDLFEITGEDHNPAFYRFVGRLKDIISRGGMKISPSELDDLLAAHPKILEAAVVGIPDATLGEKVAVAVVIQGDSDLILSEIVSYLRELGVAKFKLPEKLAVIDALPRNPLGKVIRNDLLTLFTERPLT